MKKLVTGIVASAFIVITAAPTASATSVPPIGKRGCCSHHQGVCGCSDGGRTMCCDGTVSPTCTC